MLFVHYPKCTTCKRAKKWLDEHQISYEERDIKENNPSPEMSEDEQLALLASDGMLVKRPIVVTKESVLVGFKEAQWEEEL